jgi:hypothetical protein
LKSGINLYTAVPWPKPVFIVLDQAAKKTSVHCCVVGGIYGTVVSLGSLDDQVVYFFGVDYFLG